MGEVELEDGEEVGAGGVGGSAVADRGTATDAGVGGAEFLGDDVDDGVSGGKGGGGCVAHENEHSRTIALPQFRYTYLSTTYATARLGETQRQRPAPRPVDIL